MTKTLVITGASKGIGLATAKLFVEQGYNVVNLSRTVCDLAGVSNLKVDLANHGWANEWSEELVSQVGDPDQLVLVHNAAIMTKDSIGDIDPAVLAQVLQLNVVAPAQLNRMLLPKMQTGSAILYVSSTLGTKAVANTHAYVISKHAAIGQMRASCQDLVGSGIHTAAVCPGFTETEMLQAHLGENPELYKEITSTIALGRLVQPAEIADTLWFCSQSPAINGAVIHANLGQVER
jgi:NAD(P)-dependent dehydrogenase (short-subunit alcohol dehydrogenase family)